MINIRERETILIQNGSTRKKLVSIKLLHLLFIAPLIALFSLSSGAAELINDNFKKDSGYYDGSFGKGIYWVTPGLYSSMFNGESKEIINSNLSNSNTDKLLDSNPERGSRPKRYFIQVKANNTY